MSWRDKGYFSPASTGNDASAAVLEFAQGGTAMIICGSWLLSNVKGANEDLNFDVYKLANEEDGKIYSCITANGSYSIGANTQNLDNAKMFIKWMCTAEAQKTWMDACNSVPGIPEVEAAIRSLLKSVLPMSRSPVTMNCWLLPLLMVLLTRLTKRTGFRCGTARSLLKNSPTELPSSKTL